MLETKSFHVSFSTEIGEFCLEMMFLKEGNEMANAVFVYVTTGERWCWEGEGSVSAFAMLIRPPSFLR